MRLLRFTSFLAAVVLFCPNLREVAAQSASLSLSKPTGRAVYQRNNANIANVKIQGTYGGDVDQIEARAVVRTGYGGTDTSWLLIDAAPSGGSFSASLPVTGGWYDLEVRAVKSGSSVASAAVERVGVGELFITAGQSNSANHGLPKQYPDDDRVNAYNLNTSSWQEANDPQPYATGTGGSPWPEMGDVITQRHDVPVGIVAVGVGGTTVSQWQVGGYYSRIKTALDALAEYGGPRAILWHQGESDSVAATASATYAQRLENIITQSRADAGFAVPWGVAIASYHPNASAANEAKVAAGQQMVIDADPLVFKGAETDTFHSLAGYMADSVHFAGPGLQAHGLQWGDALDASGIIVPEPASVSLLVLGAFCGLAGKRRRYAPSTSRPTLCANPR